MSIGNVPGGDRLGEVLQQMGIADIESDNNQVQSKKVEKKNIEIKDSVSQYEGGGVEENEFGLAGANNPRLSSPNKALLDEWQTGATTFRAVGTLPSAQPKPVTDVQGTPIEDGFIQLIAGNHPYAKMAILVLGEKEFEQLLQAHFQELGEPLPLNASSPAFGKAVDAIMEKHLQETGATYPEVLNESVSGGMSILQGIDVYLEYLNGVEPGQRSVLHGPKLDTMIHINASQTEMIDTIVLTLQNTNALGDKVVLMDFLKELAEVAALVRKALLESKIADTQKSGDIARNKAQVTDERAAFMKEKFLEQLKMLKMQRVMEVLGDFMRIAMYVIQALMLCVTLLFLPLAPIMTLVMFAVQVALLAIVITLTETGAMEDMFEGINELVADVSNELGISEDIGNVVFWAIIIVVILLVALLLIFVPILGALVPAIAGAIIAAVVQNSGILDVIGDWLVELTGWDSTIGKGVLKGLAGFAFSLTTGLLLGLMNIVREIVKELLKIVIELVVEIIKLVITIVIQLGVSLVKLIVKAVKAIMKAGTSAIKAAIKQVIKFILELVKTIFAFIKQIFTLVMQLLKEVMKQVIKVLKSMLKAIIKMVKKIPDMIMNLVKQLGIQMLVEQITGTLTKLIEALANVIKSLKELIQQLLQAVTSIVQTIIQKGAQVVLQLTAAGYRTAMAKVEIIKGEMDTVVAILDELLKFMGADLQKTISSEGLEAFEEMTMEMAKAFEGVIKNYSGILSKLTS